MNALSGGDGAERLIVALDVDSAEAALDSARRLAGHVGMFKIGLELFVAEGPSVVRRLREEVPDVEIFLDLKLHDIPNTMRGAIRSADYFRSTFPRFMAYDKRTTCAYTLMYLDTMWWVTHRTDVSSVAREMCYKSMIVAVGTVLEAVLRVPGEPGMGNGARGVRDRVDHALNRRWIDQRDADLLKELWQHRNRIHAHKLTRAEFGYYTKAHVDRPARALRRLVAALKEWDDARR